MKKRLFAVLFTAILTVSFGSFAFADEAETETEYEPFSVSIGVDSSVFSAQIRVAEEAGIFEKYNIDAELVTYSYGIDTVNGVILNEVQVGEANDYAVATRASEAANLRLVTSILSGHGDSKSLYANIEEIQSGEDLAGKNIAVASGTVNELEVAKTLTTYGLTEDDVNLLYFTSDAEMIAAFASYNVDAVWLSKQYADDALAVEGAHTIADLDDIDNINIAYLVVDSTFAEENVEYVERLILALNEATEIINSDTDLSADYLTDSLGIAKEDAVNGLGTYDYDIEFTQSDVDHIVSIAEWSIENGLIENDYDLNNYIFTDAVTAVLPEKVDF
ncbi:MAG: ABC transporter substrate-binding protein [Lachnospiraceae bacterium]|nr:ABC transporter substrate-binding protein [Lachnospiraceae bacterium]